MDTVNLVSLASQQAKWLAVRQSAVAGNVANANTPGYGAVDVEPFESVLRKSGVHLASTNAGHQFGNATAEGFKLSQEDPTTAMMPSKNTVVMEDELLKAGEIRRGFELNTAIVKAFHRMTLMSLKG